MWQKSKNQIVTIIKKKSNGDQTPKLKLWQNSNCDKTQETNCSSDSSDSFDSCDSSDNSAKKNSLTFFLFFFCLVFSVVLKIVTTEKLKLWQNIKV